MERNKYSRARQFTLVGVLALTACAPGLPNPDPTPTAATTGTNIGPLALHLEDTYQIDVSQVGCITLHESKEGIIEACRGDESVDFGIDPAGYDYDDVFLCFGWGGIWTPNADSAEFCSSTAKKCYEARIEFEREDILRADIRTIKDWNAH